MMWPFTRKTKPAPTIPFLPPVFETWRAGDIAECIRDTWIGLDGEGSTPPRRGSRTCVTTVFQCDQTGHTFLVLAGYGSENYWYAGGFRKIVAPFVGAEDAADERLPREELVDG